MRPTDIALFILAIGSGPAWIALYKTFVEKTFQHALDSRIESLRAELRRDEEAFKAQLRARDVEIQALRDGVLTGMTARRSALERRRTEAIERLWGEVVELQRLKFLSRMTRGLKIDVMLKTAAGTDTAATGMRGFAKDMLEAAGIQDNWKSSNAADKERIYIPPVSWAIFSAYQLVLTYPISQLIAIKTGVGEGLLEDFDKISAPLKAALPEYVEFIDKYGASSPSHLVDTLESKLFESLVAHLNSEVDDAAAIAQAAAVMEKVNEAAQGLASAKLPAAPKSVQSDENRALLPAKKAK